VSARATKKAVGTRAQESNRRTGRGYRCGGS